MNKPKLLPLEYCSLDRAARLLGCEVQDLLHWGSIGAIKLCLNGAGSGVLLDIEKVDKAKNGEEIADFIRTIYTDSYDLTRISLYSSFDQSLSSNYFHDDLVKMSAQDVCDVPVYFEGFWAIDPFYIPDISNILADIGYIGAIDDEIKIFSPLPDENDWIYRGIIHIPNDHHVSETKLDNIYIIRPDLERLYKVIHDGGVLDNIYNNAELARKNREQELKIQPENTPRVTTKQSDMIKALILIHPELEGLVDNANGLLAELEKLCARKGIKTPVSDAKTIRDWLSRANIREIQ